MAIWMAALALALAAAPVPSLLAAEVKDQRGRSVTFDKPAQRAVFLPMPGPATYMAIDGSDRNIVGMNSYSASAMREGILGRLFPGYSRISTNITMGAGTTPNVESILALRPDVVFQWATSGDDAIEVLDRTGLRVLGMRYGSQADMQDYVTMMGQTAGKEQRATELNRRQDDEKRKIERIMAGVPDTQRARVLYLGRTTDSLRVSGKESYSDFYIRLAGGRNVAADIPSSTVTIEQILTWNPQVVLLGNFDTAMPADIYNDPRWQSIDAVKTRRVYRMPLGGYRWDPPSQESALAWIWLSGLLHPDRERTDLRVAMRDWFVFLYQYALTDDEIDGILYTAQNRLSIGYERYLTR